MIAFLKLKLRQRASESVSRGTEFLAQSRVKLSPPCHDGIDCLPFSPLSGVSGVTNEGDSLAISLRDKGNAPLFLVLSVS